jgi:intracellular septation protein
MTSLLDRATSAAMDANDAKPKLNPVVKQVLDFGPLLLLFAANLAFGIFVATGVVMVASVVALAVAYALTRRLPIMPLVTAIMVLVFGTLTLVLHDEHFIKVKPTIVYVLLGGTLLGGLAFGKSLLGLVLDSVLHLTEEGWRKLTLRWAIFFFMLAVLNEIVWRTQSTDVWVSFKVFGAMGLSLVFGALQYPLLTRYGMPEPAE